MAYNNLPLMERFQNKVRVEDDCWLWTASHVPKGYGLFTPYGVGSRTYAHRFSYEYFVGSIPPGLMVMHTCDTPACVNPAHLWLGTNADNMRDCSKKGRISNQHIKRRAA